MAYEARVNRSEALHRKMKCIYCGLEWRSVDFRNVCTKCLKLHPSPSLADRPL